MVVIDLRVFLDLQVSVCELGAFDYLFESIYSLFIWLCCVLVAVYGIFSCIWDLVSLTRV